MHNPSDIKQRLLDFKENLKKINDQLKILLVYEQEILTQKNEIKKREGLKKVAHLKGLLNNYIRKSSDFIKGCTKNPKKIHTKTVDSANDWIERIKSSVEIYLGNMDQYRPEPFEGFGVRSFQLKSTGVQAKKVASGKYTNQKNPKEKWYIKSSGTYPADDISEVVTSGLLISVIGEARAVPYHFMKTQNTGEVYVGSMIRPNCEYLSDLTKKKWSGFIATHSSNPWLTSNKQIIQQCIKEKEIQNDMAHILAGCLLFKEEDCQVGNIVLYQDEQGKTRASKFDDGWGLADIFHDKAKEVRLFKSKTSWGSRGTHKAAGLPTNHFVDYPEVLHSEDFVIALRQVAATTKENVAETVNNQLERVLENFEKESDKLKALTDFSGHMGLKIPNKYFSSQRVREFIEEKLTARLIERAKSMEVLAELMNLKLLDKNFPDKTIIQFKEELEQGLIRLYAVVQKNYPDMRFHSFMPPFEARDGFTTLESGHSALISDLLKAAKASGHSLDPACEEFCSNIRGLNSKSHRIETMDRLAHERQFEGEVTPHSRKGL